ncbi:MAG: response regulator [Bacteroidota bacterium]
MKKFKILLVDDDPDIIRALQVMLENQQYIVVTARNKAEGIQRVNEENPDLAILDVMMDTTQEGFEMARELKKDIKYKSLPIILLTSIDSKTGVNFKSAAGEDDLIPVNAYIEKSAPPHELIAEIKRILSLKAK